MRLSVPVVLAFSLFTVSHSPAARGQCACEPDIAGAFGACDPDGFCNVHDVSSVLACMTGADQCDGVGCDVNCDGTVDLLDASYPLCCFSATCSGCALPPVGACCYQNLAGTTLSGCSLATAELCDFLVSGGWAVYMGDGTVCTPNPCDCNNNGIPDDTETDCNGNGLPDDCEDLDCNTNGVSDCVDIANLTSADCNANGKPDECENFGCCGPAKGACGNTNLAICDLVGGTWMGVDCLTCPSQSVAFILEGDGSIFTHNIGAPVDCMPGVPPAPSPAGPCPPAQFVDPWESPLNGAMCHNFGVTGSPAIPADFFAPGSDPFTGAICLQGVPLGPTTFGDFGTADTLISRTSDPFDRCSLPPAGPTTIPIEIVALSLVSVAPITVTFNGGQSPEDWSAAVDLSTVASPPGSLTATKSHCNGGTYISTLNVLPRFTFTKVADPVQVRVLDTGVEGLNPIVLDQSAPVAWVHDVDPPFDATLDPCTSFHPGLNQASPTTNCDCDGNTVRDKCDIEQCPGDPACSDCNGNWFLDSCDIAIQSSFDTNANGVPDECEMGVPIPTVSQWALVVLALLLVATGTIVFRRRETRCAVDGAGV